MIRVLNSSNINKSWVFDTGDGTENNPYYWEYVCDESKTGVSGTVSPTNNQYYKFLLKSGTTYTFRYNKDGTWDGDMRISFVDSEGNWIKQDWDNDPVEQFDYTPSKDETCLLRIQPYSSYSGNFKYSISPAPEFHTNLNLWKKKKITLSDGIDDIGYLNKYQDIEDANIMFKENTNDKYSKLYISFENDIYDSAEGNSSPMTLNATNVSIENGFGIFSGSQINCNASNFNFQSDMFTVDFYINFSSLPTSDSWSGTSTIFAAYDSEGSTYQNALRFGNNNINFQYEDNNWIISTPMIMSINKWYYFALVKNMNQYYMFINGKKVAESTNDYSLPNYPNCQLFHEARTSYFNGKIKNFNMSFGIARYIKDFNPPKVNGIILE